MLSIEGPEKTIGVDALRGIEIAIDDKGQLLGHQILLTGDNLHCLDGDGNSAAKKLVSDKTIVAVIGPSCSREARSAAPVLSNAGFTLVSPSNSGSDLTDPSSHVAGYLRTYYNDSEHGFASAEYAYNTLGARTAATINDDSPFHAPVAAFATRFRELGGSIVAEEILLVGSNVRSILGVISAKNPDLIYFPLSLDKSSLIAIRAREIPNLRNTILIGADDLNSPDFLKITKATAEGMYFSYPDFSFMSDYQEFLNKHQKEYGVNPISVVHAYGYDAAIMIFAAIERVAVVDPDKVVHIGRQALRDALYATKEFRGLTGLLTCDLYGDCSATKMAVFQIISADPNAWNPGGNSNSNPRKVYPNP